MQGVRALGALDRAEIRPEECDHSLRLFEVTGAPLVRERTAPLIEVWHSDGSHASNGTLEAVEHRRD
jgi:hypothetical protein